jgi:hypothetical protein
MYDADDHKWLEKANPYHDNKGRFTSGSSGTATTPATPATTANAEPGRIRAAGKAAKDFVTNSRVIKHGVALAISGLMDAAAIHAKVTVGGFELPLGPAFLGRIENTLHRLAGTDEIVGTTAHAALSTGLATLIRIRSAAPGAPKPPPGPPPPPPNSKPKRTRAKSKSKTRTAPPFGSTKPGMFHVPPEAAKAAPRDGTSDPVLDLLMALQRALDQYAATLTKRSTPMDDETDDEPTKKRRVLHKLKIDEISAVDMPAQEHAKMVIMKRYEPDPISELSPDLAELDKRIDYVTRRGNYDASEVAALEADVAAIEKQLGRASGSMAKVAYNPTHSVSFAKRLEEVHLDGLRGCEALSKARRSVSQREFEDYQAGLQPRLQPTLAKSASVRAFEDLAKQIAREDRVPLHRAMSKARVDFPDEYESYQLA